MSGGPLHSCFDFRLRSEIPLGDLPPAEAGDERPVVEVRLGKVQGGDPSAGLRVDGGDVVLTVEGVAGYLIRGTREIVVQPAPDASERSVRLFLLGSALGILCHRRGLMPLHANAVVAGDGAYAFAGPSGAGKSTLAAHFAREGYPVLCDDVCVVSFAADGTPLAWPGLPRLKLWSDAARAFGHDGAALEPVAEGFDKYHLPLPPVARTEPVPLRRLYLLAKADGGQAAGFRRLRGPEAMRTAVAQTYRGAYLRPLGLATQNFRHAATLIRHAEVWEARRAWGYAVFSREAERIERHVLSASAEVVPARRAS